MHLKINDTVKIISGNSKDLTGKITQVNRREQTVLVDGVNQYKRHQKTQGNQTGGIITISRPIKMCKVMLVCPHCQKTTRLAVSGTKRDKIRLCRHCQKPITSDVKKPTTKKK